MRAHFMQNYNEFQKQATEFNIALSEVKPALEFLHNIGDVAYFGDDPSDGMHPPVVVILFLN